jgi:hypothetical protein
MAFFGIGLGEQRDVVGLGAVGDEDLAAVDDVEVAVAAAPWVRIEKTSEPALGSVTPMAPTISPAIDGRRKRSLSSGPGCSAPACTCRSAP